MPDAHFGPDQFPPGHFAPGHFPDLEGDLGVAIASQLTVTPQLTAGAGEMVASITPSFSLNGVTNNNGIAASILNALTLSSILQGLGDLAASVDSNLTVSGDFSSGSAPSTDLHFGPGHFAPGHFAPGHFPQNLASSMESVIQAQLLVSADIVNGASGAMISGIDIGLSVTADLVNGVTGDISAALPSAFSVNSDIENGASGDLSALLRAALSLDPDLSNGASGDVSANLSSILNVDGSISDASSDLIAASLSTILGLAGDIGADADIQASVASIFTVSGDTAASGDLQGVIDAAMTVSAQGRSVGSTGAVVPVSVSLSADLDAIASGLVANVDLQFALSATPDAKGELVAGLLLQLDASGILFDGTGVRIPNTVQDLAISLLNSSQSITGYTT